MSAVEPVVAEGLVKVYGGGVVAVDGVSFRVRRGEVFGLLGPNGAGKTTTIGMLSTLIRPTRGRALVCGFDVVRERDRVRERVALVPQEIALDYLLSVRDNLLFYARLQGLGGREARDRVEWVMRELGLAEIAKVPVVRLSGGLMRRVQLARLFLSRAEVVFLDEPTLAMDPVAKMKAWRMIREFVERERVTAIVATNDMSEAEALCDRIAFMKQGRIVAEGSPEELKKLCGEKVVEIRVDGEVELGSVESASRVEVRSGCIRIYTSSVARALRDALSKLELSSVVDVRVLEPSLEDVFARIVGGS